MALFKRGRGRLFTRQEMAVAKVSPPSRLPDGERGLFIPLLPPRRNVRLMWILITGRKRRHASLLFFFFPKVWIILLNFLVWGPGWGRVRPEWRGAN